MPYQIVSFEYNLQLVPAAAYVNVRRLCFPSPEIMMEELRHVNRSAAASPGTTKTTTSILSSPARSINSNDVDAQSNIHNYIEAIVDADANLHVLLVGTFVSASQVNHATACPPEHFPRWCRQGGSTAVAMSTLQYVFRYGFVDLVHSRCFTRRLYYPCICIGCHCGWSPRTLQHQLYGKL